MKYRDLAQYPKYKREEKLSCKLSDKQIKEIPVLLKEGLSIRAIGREFGVAHGTIRYWLLPSDEARQEWARNRQYRHKTKKEVRDKFRERKVLKVGIEALRKWNAEYAKKLLKVNPVYKEKNQVKNKEWRKKNREKLNEYNKKWRQENLEWDNLRRKITYHRNKLR